MSIRSMRFVGALSVVASIALGGGACTRTPFVCDSDSQCVSNGVCIAHQCAVVDRACTATGYRYSRSASAAGECVASMQLDGSDGSTDASDAIEAGDALGDTPADIAEGGSDSGDAGTDAAMDVVQTCAIAVRPIAPLSNSRMTGRRFSLVAEVASPTPVAQIEFETRSTPSASAVSLPVAPSNRRASTPLRSDVVGRVVYWRARSVCQDDSRGTWSATWRLVLPTGTGAARAGLAMPGPFEVDGDDIDDYAVSSPGTVTIYRSDGGRIDLTRSSGFGSSMVNAGDIDGDGRSDLLIREDANLVSWMSSDGTLRDLPALPSSTATDSALHLAGIGDVDSDGYADVAIATGSDAQPANGRVVIAYGSPTGIQEMGELLTPNGSFTRFGRAVGAVGDTGSGYASFVVSGFNHAWRFTGQPGRALSAGVELHSGISPSEYGYAVSNAGDFNGDATPDVAIVDNVAHFVAIYSGDASAGSNPIATAPLMTTSGRISVASTGDATGDGLDDLVLGFPVENAVTLVPGVLSPPTSPVSRPGTMGTEYGAALGFVGRPMGASRDQFVLGAPSTSPSGAAFLCSDSSCSPVMHPGSIVTSGFGAAVSH